MIANVGLLGLGLIVVLFGQHGWSGLLWCVCTLRFRVGHKGLCFLKGNDKILNHDK